MRAAILVSWALSLMVILLLIGPDRILQSYSNVTPEEIRQFILSFGALSVLAYLCIHAVRPFFFLPATPFTIAGGYLFGFAYGMVYSIIGTTLSAIITFIISRYLFRDYVKQRIRGRFAKWDKDMENNGPLVVAILRVIPVVPLDIVGYIAGASGIKFKDFLAGTLIGILPGIFALTLLGSSLTRVDSTMFYVSLVVVIIVMGIPGLYRHIIQKKANN